MIPPVCGLIQKGFNAQVDMLQNFSLASVSIQQRYAALFKNFDVTQEYTLNKSLLKSYFFSLAKCRHMCYRYLQQDLAAKRATKGIITEHDFVALKEMVMGEKKNIKVGSHVYNQGECWCCHQKFSNVLHPTLVRIDNTLCHSIDNVMPACNPCNVKHNNRPMEDALLTIRLHRFALLNKLPMTFDNKDVYHLMRKFITGGIANVHQKVTKAGQTNINKLVMKDGKTYCNETINCVTHIIALDANSLYSSSTCSKSHRLNPYTGHKMYMPARLIGYYNTKRDALIPEITEDDDVDDPKFTTNKSKIINHIEDRTGKTLFIASVKGSIRATDEERVEGIKVKGKVLYCKDADEYYINKCINFAPVIRNRMI
jgi:hypothetical protein